MKVRIQYIDSISGEEAIDDIYVASLTAQAIAEEMNQQLELDEEDDDYVRGVHLEPDPGSPSRYAFIVSTSGCIIVGIAYTVFQD